MNAWVSVWYLAHVEIDVTKRISSRQKNIPKKELANTRLPDSRVQIKISRTRSFPPKYCRVSIQIPLFHVIRRDVNIMLHEICPPPPLPPDCIKYLRNLAVSMETMTRILVDYCLYPQHSALTFRLVLIFTTVSKLNNMYLRYIEIM